MLSIILTLACSDHYMAYPVDKVQDTEEETIEDPVDTIGIYDEPMDTGDYGDTGYEEPIIETDEPVDTGYDEPVEETDEPVDTGYEEPVEVEEEDTDTGSTTTTVPTDNYNYSDDFTVARIAWSGAVHYASDYGYTMIDSDYSSGANVVCGLQPTGLVDCFCENLNSVSNFCNSQAVDVIDHIPFQSFVDVSVAIGQVCTVDSNGSALCWDESGTVFNLPQMNPYVDIVSLTGDKVCSLDDQGSLYCFDTTTGGVVHSDANTYKAIEGKGSLVCGVLDDAENIECVNFYTVVNMNQSNYSVSVNHEIIGMDSDEHATCYTYLDSNNMQVVECSDFHNYANQCLYSAPHSYYYDFFTNNVDLSNVEVGAMGVVYDSSQNLEVYWGGRYSGGLWQVVNNGYYTGSGCNYYWGN